MAQAPKARKRKRYSNTYSNKENINNNFDIYNSAVDNNSTAFSFSYQNTPNLCSQRLKTFNFFPAELVNREPPFYYDEQQLQKRRRLSNTYTPNIPPFFFQKIEEIVQSIEVIHKNVLFNLKKIKDMKIREIKSKFHTLAEEGPVTPLTQNPQQRNDLSAAQFFYHRSLKNDFYTKMDSITDFYNHQKEQLKFQINSVMQQINDSSLFINDSMSIQVPVPKGPCSKNDYFLSYELITLPLYMAADFIKEEEIYTAYYLHM